MKKVLLLTVTAMLFGISYGQHASTPPYHEFRNPAAGRSTNPEQFKAALLALISLHEYAENQSADPYGYRNTELLCEREWNPGADVSYDQMYIAWRNRLTSYFSHTPTDEDLKDLVRASVAVPLREDFASYGRIGMIPADVTQNNTAYNKWPERKPYKGEMALAIQLPNGTISKYGLSSCYNPFIEDEAAPLVQERTSVVSGPTDIFGQITQQQQQSQPQQNPYAGASYSGGNTFTANPTINNYVILPDQGQSRGQVEQQPIIIRQGPSLGQSIVEGLAFVAGSWLGSPRYYGGNNYYSNSYSNMEYSFRQPTNYYYSNNPVVTPIGGGPVHQNDPYIPPVRNNPPVYQQNPGFPSYGRPVSHINPLIR